MSSDFEYLIVGAGPAGLQLGLHLAQAKRRYLIVEAGRGPGTFFRRFPRHRKLISINKVYTGFHDREKNLRWDWNSILSDDDELLLKRHTRSYWPDADTFIAYLEDFARRSALELRCGVRVTRISRVSERFQVETNDGAALTAARVIIATGVGRPYVPPIPGIELAENYVDVSVDPADFANQRVLILGKGNSAFETADNLNETAALIHLVSPHPLRMAWTTHYVGHLRSINNTILDTYQLKLQNAVLDAAVEKIERHEGRLRVTVAYSHAHGEREELVYDRVIACTGFRFDASIFDPAIAPELTISDRFPAMTSAWESVNIKGLYFAGTLTQVRDFKKSSSGFIHGFRYNVRALHQILEHRYHAAPHPARVLAAGAEAATDAVIAAVNRTSALWQQFGFLCDVLVPDAGGGRYHEALPVDYVHDTAMADERHYYTITLEYGEHSPDPFHVVRIARDDVKRAADSRFLHPVVRRYDRGRLVAEHHIIEDLEAAWVEDIHTKPLLAFFREQLGDGAARGRGDGMAMAAQVSS